MLLEIRNGKHLDNLKHLAFDIDKLRDVVKNCFFINRQIVANTVSFII